MRSYCYTNKLLRRCLVYFLWPPSFLATDASLFYDLIEHPPKLLPNSVIVVAGTVLLHPLSPGSSSV